MKSVFALLLALLLPAAQAFLPNTTQLIRCPDSEALRRWQPEGGGVVNIWAWTDGYGEPPMRSNSLSRCGTQSRVYRIDAAVIDRRDGDAPRPAEWQALPLVEPTQTRDLAEALDLGLAQSADEERVWRRELWWAANASLRGLAPPRNAINPFAPGRPARDNLIRLLALLDPADALQALERAEVLRALELHGEAQRQLDRLPDGPDWYRANAALIRSLAQRRDPLVRPTPRTQQSMREVQAKIQARPRR